MIKLTDPSGKDVYVMPNNMTIIKPLEKGSHIHIVGSDTSYYVKETPNEIQKILLQTTADNMRLMQTL